MSWSLPSNVLSKEKPAKRLISVEIISSVLIQLVIQLCFQVLAYYLITKDPLYKPIDSLMDYRTLQQPNLSDDDLEDLRCISYETTAVFMLANFEYLITNMI